MPVKSKSSTSPTTSTWSRLEGGEPVRLVLRRVGLVADADERLVEQLDDEREHLLARQAAAPQVGVDRLADVGQDLAELRELAELVGVADLPPARVVAVLLAAAGVAAGGQDVAVLRRADPHVGPRRRDRDRRDAGPFLRVGDDRAVGFS